MYFIISSGITNNRSGLRFDQLCADTRTRKQHKSNTFRQEKSNKRRVALIETNVRPRRSQREYSRDGAPRVRSYLQTVHFVTTNTMLIQRKIFNARGNHERFHFAFNSECRRSVLVPYLTGTPRRRRRQSRSSDAGSRNRPLLNSLERSRRPGLPSSSRGASNNC